MKLLEKVKENSESRHIKLDKVNIDNLKRYNIINDKLNGQGRSFYNKMIFSFYKDLLDN